MILDDLDFEIMKILQINARLSDRAVARETKSTAPTIARRIKKLRELGVIQGFSVDLNPQRLDITTILVRGTPQQKTEEIIGKISEFNHLTTIDSLSSGEIRMRFESVVKQTPVALREILEELCDWEFLEVEYSSLELKKNRGIIDSKTILLNCAYCGQGMKNTGFLLKWEDQILPCCCPICEKSLSERLTRLDNMRNK